MRNNNNNNNNNAKEQQQLARGQGARAGAAHGGASVTLQEANRPLLCAGKPIQAALCTLPSTCRQAGRKTLAITGGEAYVRVGRGGRPGLKADSLPLAVRR